MLIDNKEEDFLENIINMYIMDSKVDDIANLIKDFYKDNYEHKYYNILKYVYKSDNDELDYAIEGLQSIIDMFYTNENTEFLKCDNEILENKYIFKLEKLLDYLKLEHSRISSIKKQEYLFYKNLEKIKKEINYIEDNIKEYNNTLNKRTKELDGLVNKIEKLDSRVDKQEFSFVATLGIFTGIVMAFSGTFTIIANAVNNLNNFNIFSISFTTILTGLVLLNVIWILIYCISIIIRIENRFKRCCVINKLISCEECDKNLKCRFKFIKRNTYILINNIIGIILLIILGIVNYKIC